MESITQEEIQEIVRAAIVEDVGTGDVTTLSTIPESLTCRALMVAREPLVVAGLKFAEATFAVLSPAIRFEHLCIEGQALTAGQALAGISGPAGPILTGERVALNFLQRMSGVATLTAQYVEAIKGTGARILDTRKTTPGWRRIEKYAVACGGGRNHRIGLYDMVLIKDNHLAALREAKPNGIAAAVRSARDKYPQLKVEVETDTLEQVEQAIGAGADIILLDNMSLDQLRSAVKMVAGRAQTEASGGVNLSSVRAIAETGVTFISVGAVTHSARAVDIGLDFEA